ncbi:MAG: (deoxy)nucleoside triphosphate pyrophosphohydrolase [Bacillota bacterium]
MIKVVAAVIINEENKIFIAQRNSPAELAGLWEFPGGKIEEGELPEESLIRELDEEFGMSIEVIDFFVDCSYTYDFGSVKISSYLVKLIDKEFEVREHNDVKWIGIDEFNKFPLVPADLDIVEGLAKRFCKKE